MKTNIFLHRFFSSCPHFIGAVMIAVLIIPAIAFSQTAPVLGTASSFGILAAAAISGTTTVSGNVGTTTGAIDGTITVASGYTKYLSGDATVVTAHNDFGTAYTNALSANQGGTSLPAAFPTVNQGNDVGHPLLSGIYDITVPASMTADLYLSGSSSDIFIFKTSSTFDMTASKIVHLANGAVWSNVYWLIGGAVTLGASSTFEGTILCNVGAITVGASGAVNGALLGNGAVTVNAASVLPVELTSFTVELNNNAVELNWNTSTEVNNYGFEIERSKDNSNYENIGFVKGSGNSNSVKDYFFTDKLTLSGKYFYRLKQIDNDGAFEYSTVVEADFKLLQTFELSQNYPNPFNPTTRISYSIPLDSRVELLIYGITGELVKSLVNEYQTAGIYTIDFNAADLSSGIYFYKITANDLLQIKKMSVIK